ncbi:MAG: hypothetical protein K0R25_508 [Rickettsiaceae bacterium]|nr:hypothetical protein [Rickettsiaceae bacterium]
MHKSYNKSGRTGFSLIELAIVILIVSILITGSLTVSKTSINVAKNKVTKEKMATIYDALTNFLNANRRLPCPSLLNVAKGGNSGTTTTPNNINYGQEVGTTGGVVGTGVCSNAIVATTNAPNLAYGGVPFLALGLDPDMAEDGFGTKFTYVVDSRFTKASTSTASTDGFEITKGSPAPADTSTTDLSSADIQGPSGTALLGNKNAIMVLISHGSNKFRGFNATSTKINADSTVTDENENGCTAGSNSDCTTPTTTAFDRDFMAYSTDANFDDFVLYKTKSQLVKDAGLEYIMCSASEANMTSPGTYTWTVNSTYGCIVCSSNVANHRKTCGKYGIWGADLATTCTQNTVSNCP